MRWLQAAAVWVFLAGCGGDARVRFSVRGSPATTTQAGVSRQALQAAQGIELTRARILVRELELERDGGDDDSSTTDDSGSGSDDPSTSRSELETGPFVVDLQGAALEGGVQRVVDVAVPAGTYHELEFEIHRGTSSDERESTDPAVQAMVAKNASVILEGTVDGEPFEFVTGLEVKQEFEGTFELTAETNNLTLSVDPSGWFTSSTGGRLDPRDSSARSAIESNIKHAMKVMNDDDEDGRDDELEDDHGGHHDDGPGHD